MTGALPAHDSALWRDRSAASAYLETLGGRDSLDDAGREFLLFCFRASDPAIYQPAALSAGRLAGRDDALRGALEAYARAIGADLTRPAALNGRRSARRLSLVLAGAAAGGAGPAHWSEQPFEPAAELKSPPAPADMANMMLALTRLCAAGQTAFTAQADALLDQAADAPSSLREAHAARRFALLLAERARGAAPGARSVLSRALDGASALAADAPDDIAARLESLRLMSELARAVIESPALAGPELASAPEAFRLSGQIWARRAGVPAPDWTAIDVANGGVLEQVRRREAQGTSVQAQLECLDWLSAPLAGEGEWRWLAPEERAALMHMLMDQLRHDPPAPERARALALRRQLATGEDGLLSAVLLRLIALEGAGADPLVDYPLVHAITDPASLAALAPSQAQSGRADLIADAVENRLRLMLMSREDYDPAPWLLLILARKPVPGFLQHLRRLCEGRRYETARGEDYPLSALLARLSVLDGGETDAPRSASPLAEGAISLSGALAALADPAEPLDDAVPALADLIDHPEAGDGASLTGLIRAVQTAPGLMIAGPDAPVRPGEADTFATRLSELAGRLRARLRWLSPDAWLKADAARAGLSELAGLLRDISARAGPVLPGGIDRPLAGSCAALAARVEARAHAVTRLDAAWQDGERSLKTLLDAAGEEVDATGCRLAAVILDCLSPSVPLGPASSDIPVSPDPARIDAHWTQGRAQLDAALTLSIAGAQWTGAVQRLWAGLLRAAMEDQHEGRARALLLDARYRAIRRDAASALLVRTARLWCLDRYRPWSAFALARDLAAGAGEKPPGVISVLPAQGARLAPLWTCLLIGAILMLDFGDAWRTMAEDGDARGVAITFAIGLAGACAYLFHHLAQRSAPEPGRNRAAWRLSVAVRALGVAGACLAYALGVTALLWLLLSGTDEVVRGPYAALHIIVWAGFSLFIGVFFGLIARRN